MDPIPSAFAALARLRGRHRPVHPKGAALAGTARLDAHPALAAAVPALAEPRELRAVVRLSRSFEVLKPLPDVLGIAVRLEDVEGEGGHLDLLLVSSLPGSLTRVVPLVAVSYGWPAWSTLLPYRAGEHLVMGAARTRDVPARPSLDPVGDVHRAGRLELDLGFVTPCGTWWPLAGVRATERVAPGEAEALELDPGHDLDGLRLEAGPLGRLRERAYAAARGARRRGEAARRAPYAA